MENIQYENLKDEMETMGISVGDIAATMEIKEEKVRSLLSGKEPLNPMTAHNIASRIFATTNIKYLFHIENENDTLIELVHSLDDELGGMSLKLEDLQAIKTSLGDVMEGMENVDQSDLASMGIKFRDIYPYLRVADSLLRHSLKDLSEHHEQSSDLNDTLFKEIVHADKE